MKKPLKRVCNAHTDPVMLLGESVVRQIISAKRYIHEKSGKEPSKVFNFNSFGSGRGLVQILADSGYTFYLFYRSDNNILSLPADTFEWIGFDGSSVIAHRVTGNINSYPGRDDEYFQSLNEGSQELPQFKGDLNPFDTGCSASMKRLKQQLYNLEHKYYTAEKLLSLTSFSDGSDYPIERMTKAMKEMLLLQYFELLPEKSAGPEEKAIIKRIGNASGIINGEIAAFLLRTGNSLKKASAGEFPLMIINPHSFDADSVVEVELPPIEPVTGGTGSGTPVVFNEKGEPVAAQCEKLKGLISGCHTEKLVFRAIVPAGSTTRYSYRLYDIPITTIPSGSVTNFIFKTENSVLIINRLTGFPSAYEYEGTQLLSIESMNFSLIEENADPVFSSCIDPVHYVENGPVRTIAESQFTCSNSSIHVRYLIPNGEPWFDFEITVNRIEKDKILKWCIPVGYNMNCIGRQMSGINCCKHRKREFVFRDWLGMKNFESEGSLSICADGAYGYDIIGNTVRISLPATTDPGIHKFSFRFMPGSTGEVIDRSFNNSDLFNNPLLTRLVYPAGTDGPSFSGIRISDPSINLQAVKLNDNGDLIMRLLNPGREIKRFRIEIPAINISGDIEIGSKKLKTLVVGKATDKFIETDLTERIKT